MNRPIYLAHRGLWRKNSIENTIKSFQNTLKNPSIHCHGFECDFREIDQENQKIWVIFHDETMQRFSKKNEPVNIKVKLVRHQLNAAIPTLSEFIQFIHNLNQKIVINIEIKSGTETGISTLIKALKKANFKKYVKFIFSSFKPEIIRQLIQEKPGQIGVLIKNITAFRELKLNKKELKEVDFIIINYRNIRKKDLVQFIKMKKSIGIYFQSKTDFEKKRISAIRSYQAKLIFTEG